MRESFDFLYTKMPNKKTLQKRGQIHLFSIHLTPLNLKLDRSGE
jgi:hypothetical protein